MTLVEKINENPFELGIFGNFLFDIVFKAFLEHSLTLIIMFYNALHLFRVMDNMGSYYAGYGLI